MVKPVEAILDHREFAYRVVASILGIATFAAWRWDAAGAPSEVINAVANWAGVDLSTPIAAVHAWIQDPTRADIISTGGYALMVVTALCMAFQSWHETFHSRCAPTLLLSAAVVAEVGGPLDWWSIVAVIVALVGGAIYNGRQDGADAAFAPVVVLPLALGYAVIVPVVLAISTPARPRPPRPPSPLLPSLRSSPSLHLPNRSASQGQGSSGTRATTPRRRGAEPP